MKGLSTPKSASADHFCAAKWRLTPGCRRPYFSDSRGKTGIVRIRHLHAVTQRAIHLCRNLNTFLPTLLHIQVYKELSENADLPDFEALQEELVC